MQGEKLIDGATAVQTEEPAPRPHAGKTNGTSTAAPNHSAPPPLEPLRPDPEAPPAAAHGQSHGDDENVIPDDLPHPGNFAVVIGVCVFVLLLAGLFVIGWIPHSERLAEINGDVAEQKSRATIVEVTQPTTKAKSSLLTLPCDVRPDQETDIYPRANGYLGKLYVDIQARVSAGQVLAVIDAPEVDAQLSQSKAALEQAKANVVTNTSALDLAGKTLKRYDESEKESAGSVTAQAIDQAKATYDQAAGALSQAKANVAAAQADVEGLTATQGFEKVVAPFGGTITARNYDVGALLSPTNTGPGKQLFHIAQTDTMRVYVNVPQVYATIIKQGQPAYLTIPRNYPGRTFTGSVARISDALDLNTRTMLFELDFPNKDGSLIAGMYGEAHLDVSDVHPVLVIPTSALVFNANGTQVAMVRDGKIQFQPIKVGRDMGTEMEVTEGLTADDQIVADPGERLVNGLEVTTTSSPQEKAAAQTPSTHVVAEK